MKSRFVSQGFLGIGSPRILEQSRIAIIGLCGGGSHIAQQSAHLGIGNFVVFDHDHVEHKNRNRMIGATPRDAELGVPKTEVLDRMIKQINAEANVLSVPKRWQEDAALLRDCDVIFGCVDKFSEREQLEATARRYLIPYIDIGMDVWPVENGFSVGGQVFLSMPGGPCLRCCGILTEERLALEAAEYGAVGGRPQVVWPNGVLASAAVGVFVQMICAWRDIPHRIILLEYSGENHTLAASNRVEHLEQVVCPHFSNASSLGDPFWTAELPRALAASRS